MKNYAMPMAIATVGVGLLSIGFNLNGNTATATPAAFNAGPGEPTIVWYGMVHNPRFVGSHGGANTVYGNSFEYTVLARAWSHGVVEAKKLCSGDRCDSGIGAGQWIVIASPNEGLNAAADINFDERVDAADLGQLIAAWGDAPRNDYPPSDCPLGLIP